MTSKTLPLQALLQGLQPPELVQCLGAQVQPELVPALTQMAQAAAVAGFQLRIASGYRDFARQLHIFNGKANGLRPLLDSDGKALEVEQLSEPQLLAAILRWSALPGASRHHWGSDFDVYDAGVCGPDYQLALTVAECEGVMAPFHKWLTGYLSQQEAFFRPYLHDRGGVAPEPWHLSYRPLAEFYAAQFDIEALRQTLLAADLALKSLIVAELPALVERYVTDG